ncbi:Ankyrin repeats (3 copies) [Popillia japonica]|uniref:Ankyrin repeats (3 copies) n=1 Tax=Popillia japonica TaxID=7064 RepID=A0AAW1ICT1_POPJA
MFKIRVVIHRCISGNLNIFEIALKGGVNVNVQNPSGHTPLHVAVLNNNEVIVEKLLENGADVNLKTNAELTPLCFAKLRGYTNITELFTAFKLSMNAH